MIDLDTVDVEPEAPRPEGRPATEKQISFIARLVRDRDTSGMEQQLAEARELVMARTLSTRVASDLIEALLGAPRVQLEPSVTEGMYRTADGTIYKVQHAVHGSGHLYAKRLVLDAYTDTWVFEYAPSAVRHLTLDERLTLEQAKEFGALYGSCAVCGRTLTNEASIAEGIGPVCAGRL